MLITLVHTSELCHLLHLLPILTKSNLNLLQVLVSLFIKTRVTVSITIKYLQGLNEHVECS